MPNFSDPNEVTSESDDYAQVGSKCAKEQLIHANFDINDPNNLLLLKQRNSSEATATRVNKTRKPKKQTSLLAALRLRRREAPEHSKLSDPDPNNYLNPSISTERKLSHREKKLRANLHAALKRKNETPQEREIRRAKDKLRKAEQRKEETEAETRLRRRKGAARVALTRSLLSDEERAKIRKKGALRAAYKRSIETEEQRQERRLKCKNRAAQIRQNETGEEYMRRKQYNAYRAAVRRSMLSDEEREAQNIRRRERVAALRQNKINIVFAEEQLLAEI